MEGFTSSFLTAESRNETVLTRIEFYISGQVCATWNSVLPEDCESHSLLFLIWWVGSFLGPLGQGASNSAQIDVFPIQVNGGNSEHPLKI